MYMLGVCLGQGMWPTGRLAAVLDQGCPTCGRIYDRVAAIEPDGSVKMICKGCNTAYWTGPAPNAA